MTGERRSSGSKAGPGVGVNCSNDRTPRACWLNAHLSLVSSFIGDLRLS